MTVQCLDSFSNFSLVLVSIKKIYHILETVFDNNNSKHLEVQFSSQRLAI